MAADIIAELYYSRRKAKSFSDVMAVKFNKAWLVDLVCWSVNVLHGKLQHSN